MAYAPPRIEIYQVLKKLTKALETPLLPFCIIGPAYRVKDTNIGNEQFATDYNGGKQTVVFNTVDSQNILLKREGVEVKLYVSAKSGSTVLPDIEIVQDSKDTVLLNDTAVVNGAHSIGATSIAYNTGLSGHGLTNYVGSDNAGKDFYVIINGVKYLATGDTKSTAGVDGTLTLRTGLVSAMTGGESVQVIGNEVYYDSAEHILGNLSATVMNAIKEGDYVFKKNFGSTSYYGDVQAHIVNVNTYDNSIMLDVGDLAFTPSNVGPAATTTGENDFFNVFPDIVSVAGYIDPVSPYEEKFVPNDAISDYTGKIIDTGIMLPSGMVDGLGNLITNAVIQSTYTTYEKSLNKSTNIVNVPMLITKIDDIEKNYGEIRPENELAYGAFLALASQKAGYTVAVEDTALVGYTQALEKMKEIDAYAFVALTHNTDVISAFKSHAEFMSEGQQSRWRIAIVNGENVPEKVTIVSNVLGTAVPDNSSLSKFVFRTPLATSLTPGDVLRLEDIDSPEINGDYTIVGVDDSGQASSILSINIDTTFYELEKSSNIQSIASNVVTLDSHSLSVGDLVWLEGLIVGAENGWYTVAATTATTITLSGLTDQAGVSGTVTKSQVISGEIFSSNPAYRIAVEAKNFASSLSSRRVWNLFPDACVVEEPDVLHGYYAAASYAGMVGAFPGPDPYTEENVPLITKVYGSSDIMGYDYLNIVAEGGNTILYNAGVGGLPTVRDQLTTDMSSVLTQYHSVTVNVDFISFTLKSQLIPLKGKHNIDQNLIDAAKITTTMVLDYFTTGVGSGRIIEYTDPEVGVEAGCVVVRSELTVPIPGNTIKVILNLTA